jgi:hypothetical protein
MFPYGSCDRRVIEVQIGPVGLSVRLDDGHQFDVVVRSPAALARLDGFMRQPSGLEVLYMSNGMTEPLWERVREVLRASHAFTTAIVDLPTVQAQVESGFDSLFRLPLLAYPTGRPLIYVGHPVDFQFETASPPSSVPPGRYAYGLLSDGDTHVKVWVDTEKSAVYWNRGSRPGHFL